ncbi:MFS transporter [Corynebacterium diphtheriae bv. mitis]|uniref:MFS transporter n=1 Tax=Corynebacterium diphtheriae TaxID=1717 RepID=UPI0013CB5E1F|nr:MFS transporter [Corynebacterium diphtheriae]MBG9276619.1 MFS transporter [Corynebacterium diphtheriae bv. mitis]MBG9281003.1 MFS transporter [Corynebacterium diphtheriae bv. mitis]CAB0910674.1 MFS transporter [Corynebacterium diphtheriae]CAB0912461.1 MFS transporter [Corynebacterium diphtheriae]
MKTLEATSIQPAAPTQPWKVPGFTSTLIAVAAAFAAFSLMLPVIPLAVIASGQSDALAGATTATFMAITVLTQICTSRLIHAFGYRAVMIVAALLLGLPSLWYAVSLDPASVLIVAAIRGIGFGSLCVAQYALIGEIVPAGMLGKASGLLGVAVGASQMVALPAGLLLVNAGYSFDVVFFIGGGIALIAAFMAVAIPNVESDASSADAAGNDEAGVAIDGPAWRRAELKYERRQRIIHSKVVQKAKFAIPAKPRAKISARIHRRPRPHGLIVTVVPALALASVSMGYGAVSSFLPASVRDIDPARGAALAGIMLSIVGAAQMIFRFFAGMLADKLNRPGTTMIPGLILSALGLAGLVAVLALGWPLATLICAAILFGAGFGLVQNEALLEMFLRVPREKIGQASTIWNAAFDSGTGVGAIMLGMVAAHAGYAMAFAGGTVLVAIGFIAELTDRGVQRRHRARRVAASVAD